MRCYWQGHRGGEPSGSSCEQRKNLLARKHTAGKGSTCGQEKTLPAEVPIRYSAAKRADEMKFIVRSQREP